MKNTKTNRKLGLRPETIHHLTELKQDELRQARGGGEIDAGTQSFFGYCETNQPN